MSTIGCGGCGHWCGPGRDHNDPDQVRQGACTLNPVWEPTRSDHFCSQLDTFETHRSVQSLRNDAAWQRRVIKDRDEQQNRAIEAEKKLKEARAKIRVLKKGVR